MKTLLIFTKRNIKYFFKDKVLFFTSLITPAILLFLFVTFLGQIYEDSVSSILKENINLIYNPNKFLNTFSFEFLCASLFSTCCVTIPFSVNLIMVNDKSKGMINDINVTPFSKVKLCISYYISTVFSSMIVLYFAFAICLICLGFIGFNLTFIDVLKCAIDILIMILFATSLSSVITCLIKSEGSMSALSTIVSSAYGFLAGAYMPLSQYNDAIRNLVSFLPGTYGTILFKKHFLAKTILELENASLDSKVIDEVKTMADINFEFFSYEIKEIECYLIIIISTFVFLGVYILLTILKSKKYLKKD